MTPMLEDLLLLNVIREIDSRLPAFVKAHYNHKMKKDERLMDFKSDIMVNIPSFILQLESAEQMNSFKEDLPSASLHAFRQTKTKGNARNKTAQAKKYCRLCFKSNMPREVFTSHNLGDQKCTQMSFQDRNRLLESLKFANIKEIEDSYEDEEEVAQMFGYSDSNVENNQVDEVTSVINDSNSIVQSSRETEAKCSYIKPVPSQILTMYQDSPCTVPIHIDLDSGATVNYCLKSEAVKFGFKIHPNGQMSKLGDGRTKLKSIGEIHEYFFRNNWKVKFSALVCDQLTAPFIGGTVFMKENGVEQDFNRNVIHIHNKEITVQPTDPLSILPTASILASSSSEVNQNYRNKLLSFKSRILLPGQTQNLSIEKSNGDVVAVEPWEKNNNSEWPEPHFQEVKNGKISLQNNSNNAIILGKDVKFCRIRDTSDNIQKSNPDYYSYQPKLANISESSNVNLITHGEASKEAKELIKNAHEQFASVFDKDLSTGYNGFYGKHECSLNWATKERPLASKVRVPSYDHDLKGLQQELMDDLTRQGVLLIPQEHNINVQSVCPSFLQRKQRAKDKPKHSLTKDDVRLLINFGPVNDKIKPVPIHVTKTDDVLVMLGRWKHIIVCDMLSGYFQNHMEKDSMKWLGVQTPFGGLRVMARSGQGLMGMAEEFDELLAKVLKEELKDGICTKIVDDIVVGGNTDVETAMNYFRVLAKLSNANLKITPEKTHIFPKSADILGWKWKEGGFLEASPHRKFALANTKIEDIKTVKDMRSWVGLFKTLHIVTPKISEILAPFETSTAGKESKETFEWTHDLESQFRDAKDNVSKMVNLYLPSPDDQLLMETDASKIGIGHVLFVVKDGKKLPVRIHSAKLPDKCKTWAPCEVESLAFAAGIDKEYDILRESKLPLIICPDSKPVHEAVKLINSGKFSTSARMSSFLTNVNRTRIESRHISGKAKLNPIPDLQSRFPSDCSSEFCSVHKFINGAVDSIVDEGAKNCSIVHEDGFTNRESWKNCQKSNQACSVAKQFLTSGKPPPKAIGKNTGDYWNDVRQYCRDATVAKDGLLVVKSKPDVLSGNIARERIVIPKPLVPALLYHIHNHNDKHPVKTQQKASFQRQFYAIHLDKHLDLLYQNCYKCSIIQKIPKQIIPNETKTVVTGPQTHFHADVIKRSTQNILLLQDHFSSYQDAMILDSEKAADLKEGLISLSSTMRRPSDIFISIDNSPGFKSLLSNIDNDLKMLKINLVKTDEINKNSNAVVDKGCQELENEIKRLEPGGLKISLATLKLAVMNLNSKLRRRGNISAYEIHSARDQNTGTNMNLNDESLRENQLEKRKDKVTNMKTEEVIVGDTVRIANKTDKHKASEMFIVTAKENNDVEVQKILHPLQKTPAKLMSKIYKTNQKHLVTVHRPEFPKEVDLDEPEVCNEVKVEMKRWNPINQHFYKGCESDDEDEGNAMNSNYDDILNNDDDPDLSWDNSPELLALGLGQDSSDNEVLRQALHPRRLFDDANHENTSDGDVFDNDNFETPPSAPKLQRRNAMRKRHRPHPKSEPRVTRTMLRSNDRYQSISNPNSPSEVILNRAQNLGSILNPRNPVIPEVVTLGPAVQRLERALSPENDIPRRRSARDRPKVDYKQLNEHGRK